MAALAFALIISFLGTIMGVILFKGTKQVNLDCKKRNSSAGSKKNYLQKRVGYLKAWLIYGITALAVSIIGIILNASGSTHSSTVGTAVVSGILGIGINLFTLVVVYIHMKEINEGVFIP